MLMRMSTNSVIKRNMMSEPAVTGGGKPCADPGNNRMIIKGNIKGFSCAIELFPSLVCSSPRGSGSHIASGGLHKSGPAKKVQKDVCVPWSG